MLYIGSALTPTAISHTIKVQGLTGPDTTSIVIAKPDRIEVWDVTARGLEHKAELLVWGTIVGLDSVLVQDARPHIIVLVGPPKAHLLLVTFAQETLVITSSMNLSPPTPTLRHQQFFTAVKALGTAALVSIWTGLLVYVEMELEKTKDANKRRASQATMEVDGQGRRVVFKRNVNLNIAEHNLLGLVITPNEGPNPSVMLLTMSETQNLRLHPRALQLSGAVPDLVSMGPVVDVVNPLGSQMPQDDDLDFNNVPFSCPAARNILPIPGNGPNGSKMLLVIGDEHAVLYSVTPQTPPHKLHTSSRANSARRSPQTETGGVGKKRKSSTSGRGINVDGDERWVAQPVWRVRQGFGIILSSTVIDHSPTGGTVLLGDESGRLTAVGWEFDDDETVHVGRVEFGTVAPPTALTYLGNNHLFASSASGDSTLVKLNMSDCPISTSTTGSHSRPIQRKGKGRAQDNIDSGTWTVHQDSVGHGVAEILERWMNIAPVKDFTVVEEEDGRVSSLIVGSGTANSNSLRVVRSGVGFDSVLTVEGINDIQRIWALSPPGSEQQSLLLSFSQGSLILQLEPTVSALTVAQEISKYPTLAAGLVRAETVLAQVTPAAVQLWSDTQAGESLGSYVADSDEIVAAAIEGDIIVAAFRSGVIRVFNVASGANETLRAELQSECASIDIFVGANASTSLVAVGGWDGVIKVFSFDSLPQHQPLATQTETTFASSLLFRKSRSGTPELLAGLSDGTFVTYSLDTSNLASSLQDSRSATSLGSQPLMVAPLNLDSPGGEEQVLAAGISERLSMVFHSRGHIEVSSSGKKDVVAAASITTSSLGSVIILATSDSLSFERLTSLKKLQIQTLDLGNTSAYRLAALPNVRIFALGAMARTLDHDTGDVFQASSLEIRDSTTLERLTHVTLQPYEVVTSVNGVLLNGRYYIAVGTALFPNEEAIDESPLEDISGFLYAEAGRLLLVEASSDASGKWSATITASMKTTSPIVDFAVIHGFLATASAAKVSIVRLDSNPSSLREVATFTFAFEAHYLHVLSPDKSQPAQLVVGDAMRSILLLNVDEETGEIRDEQRDMSAYAVRALGGIEDGGSGVIIADDHANLLTFRLDDEIEQAASFGLHEDIARFRMGSLAPASAAPDTLHPEVLFATASGRIGSIGKLGDGPTATLSDLQRNMNKYLKGPGGLEWRTYRRGGSALVPKETAGFIDGDFVQTFLDLPESDQLVNKVMSGSTAIEAVRKSTASGNKEAASREDVVKILETVANLS